MERFKKEHEVILRFHTECIYVISDLFVFLGTLAERKNDKTLLLGEGFVIKSNFHLGSNKKPLVTFCGQKLFVGLSEYFAFS